MAPDDIGRVPTELAPAEAPWRGIYPPRRELALSALLGGATVTAAAEEAGVTRQTVSGWLNHDADFAAEFAERRRELAESARRGLEARVVEAVGALRGLLRHNDPFVRLGACRVLVSIVAQSGPPGAPGADAARRVLGERPE
jgi:transposase-like protein